MRRDGFVILPDLLSNDLLAAATRHADRLLDGVGWSDNDFDGRRTRRVYSLLSDVGDLEPGQGAQLRHFDAGVAGPRRLSPRLRRLAGLARATEYLGLVAGQDPERWMADRPD